MQVPLLDLKAQYQTLKSEIEEMLLRVAESQWLIFGPELDALEKTLAEYCNCDYAIGVSSGTDALLMALMAFDIGHGDEVILPTYSFFATAGVVARLNAKPVFVDSDPISFNIDPELIEKVITEKTKAIITVHLYGQSAEMDKIIEIANNYNLPVIEDGAQAIGAQYKDHRKVGSIGKIGCFSFYPTKNLGGFGDGGLVTTNNPILAIKLKQMRNHGMEPKYYHKFVGGNFRLDAIQAGVLNIKFRKLESWHQARRNNAEYYSNCFKTEGLSEFPGQQTYNDNNKVLIPQPLYKDCGAANYHIYNQYIIRVEKRDELRSYLADKGISTEIYYPVPFHRQECFANYNFNDSDFPVANKFAAESIALPIYPELQKEQIKYVVDTIAEFMKQ